MVRNVIGMRLCRPPMLRMSCSPLMAWITEPEPRNSERFEESMGEHMEHAGGKGAYAQREEHVAELRDG